MSVPAARGRRTTTDGLRSDHRGVLHLQRAAGNAAVATLLSNNDPYGMDTVIGRAGQPLGGALRTEMEVALGADFSDVRVHVGGEADTSARALAANAYTNGDDIVFAGGQYDPDGDAGRRVLAHELTHVVQQRSGPVDGTETGGGVAVSDPSDRFEREADATAEEITSGQRGSGPVAGGLGHGSTGPDATL